MDGLLLVPYLDLAKNNISNRFQNQTSYTTCCAHISLALCPKRSFELIVGFYM